MGLIPNVYEEHEANSWIEKLAPVALVVGIALVIFFQQFLRMESGATLVTPLPEIQAYEVAREPQVGTLIIKSKILLKECHFLHLAHEDAEAKSAAKDFEKLKKVAVSRVDRFRVAIVAADFLGAKAGVERLEKLEKEVEPNGDLAAEVFWMLKRYRNVAQFDEYESSRKMFEKEAKIAKEKKKQPPEKPAALKGPVPTVESMSDEMRTAIVARHGFFGRLALVQGPDRDEGARNELLGGLVELQDFEMAMVLLRVGMGVAGLVILGIFLWIHMKGDHLGLGDPIAPTTVYLEMFAILVLAFAVMTAIHFLLLGSNSPASVAINKLMMWTLPFCVIWPRLRGVAWSDAIQDLGLHRGAGVMQEIMVGVGGACASIPLMAIVDFVINIFQYVARQGEGEPSSVRAPGMYDVPDGTTWGLLWLGTLSAIVWAPLLEETMFRGALQRWLRVRLAWPLAVLASSAIFGFVHPYSLSGLVSVAFGGICFGLMREWRQCLIAPMVMHFIWNGFISLERMGFLIKLG